MLSFGIMYSLRLIKIKISLSSIISLKIFKDESNHWSEFEMWDGDSKQRILGSHLKVIDKYHATQ